MVAAQEIGTFEMQHFLLLNPRYQMAVASKREKLKTDKSLKKLFTTGSSLKKLLYTAIHTFSRFISEKKF
jgi:hypothetical protein